MNSIDPHRLLDQLRELEALPGPSQQETVESARAWQAAIEGPLRFLTARTHPIVFIGKVGVGKSSLIGIAANLIVGSAPTDKTSLRNHSVLATGSGRTTVCEVRIRSSREGDAGAVGLLIDPLTEEEMAREIALYAEEEWQRCHPELRGVDEEDAAPPRQEVQRVIRGMARYAEYQESVTERGVRRRRTVRPLDAVIPQFDSAESLAAHLRERAELPRRTQTAWWWQTLDEQSLRELKLLFGAVNQGDEPTAMLPKRMTVVVPDVLPDDSGEWDLSLVDTRGLDGAVESRSDLQEYLRDPSALLVLCTSFKDAPDAIIRALLHSMTGDAELRLAIPRTLLLLVDTGDADQVNGADGDREAGQELKIDECLRVLEATPLSLIAPVVREQVIAFDVLKDERRDLVAAVGAGVARLREAKERVLAERLEEARRFVAAAGYELRSELRERVDQEIRMAMAAHLPVTSPLTNPLAGALQAIGETRYASVVYATCRRNGTYFALDLYAAVKAEASRAATLWLDGLVRAVAARLDTLAADPALERIGDYIGLSKQRFRDAHVAVTQEYAERVYREVQESLQTDPVWSACGLEWGRGPGFKARVAALLEGWVRRQPGLIAHETTTAPENIPLWSEVVRPAQAPAFTLHVRNLRALRHVQWSPEPLSLLVGANGAGKTTLLLVLRLLSVAYERGLPLAVGTVLGGSGNLRSGGAAEGEPVELGLDVGEARWRIRLTPRDGSVDYLTDERLYDGAREVFSRDPLGAFIYGNERLEPTSQLGLRSLMDRGTHEPAVRAVSSFLRHICVYHDPDLWMLREKGSSTSEDRTLHSRGTNALAVLRRWSQERANRHRYQFVVGGLGAAFPNIVEDLDFQEAGNTLVARVYRPGAELPTPLAAEASGVLQLLVLLCEVAGAEDDSVVAIDEPENSLHPYALRTLLRRAGSWARQHQLTVLLATHSTVLLDELSATPEQVFVMKAAERDAPMPTRLNELCDPGWLEGFKLGDLYEQGEIGSNEDEAV